MRSAKHFGALFVLSVAATVVAFAATSASATTYYVSQSSGNDESNGQAAATAWKTLTKASSVTCVPGDKILLKCGDTWDEELHPQGNGTPENPIFIGSYGEGPKPIIDRQDEKKDLIGIDFKDQEGFKIVGIEFAHCMTGIYAEYSAGSPTKKYFWIEDCYFRDSLTYGVYKTYPKPRSISLGICFFSYELKNNIVVKDVTVKNCVFKRLASAIWTNSPDNFNPNANDVYNFGNFVFEGCLFEDGSQWQQGMRGVDGGAMRNCVTHDIGRKNIAWNGVAGAMFFRCKNWVFENCEWGFISIGPKGKGRSGDGEAFDFEGVCSDSVMRNCLFHDTEGPCFLICCYASSPIPNTGITMDKCVLNGKALRSHENKTPKCEIFNTTDWNQVAWKDCRFYIAPGEVLMRTADPEKDKKASFANCLLKELSVACKTPKLDAKTTASPEGDASKGQWIELDFGKPTLVNEFKIKEDSASTIVRYQIQCWDDKESKWIGCFNGRTIGADFVAPIIPRTTQKARLLIMQTENDKPGACAFEAYCDLNAEGAPIEEAGQVFSAPVGREPPGRAGK